MPSPKPLTVIIPEILSKIPDTGTGCEICDGFGNLITPKGVKECDCKKEFYYHQRMALANIPPRYLDATLDNFVQNTPQRKKAYEFATGYINQYKPDQKGLLLQGDCGTGKTHLAIAILKKLIYRGYTGFFCNLVYFLEQIRLSFDENTEVDERQRLFEMILEKQIVIIDDLGAEKQTPWVADRTYYILNNRYTNNLTTIITTNCTPAEIKTNVSPRIFSRIFEMTNLIPPDIFSGTDYRIEKSKADLAKARS